MLITTKSNFNWSLFSLKKAKMEVRNLKNKCEAFDVMKALLLTVLLKPVYF